jgi:hypothetical protein
LFDAIASAESHMQFQVMASYYEIYCEKIRDLLNPSQVRSSFFGELACY